MSDLPKFPVRIGAAVDAASGDVTFLPDLAEGFMRIRTTERRTPQNRNPKTSEIRVSKDQWDEFVTQGDRILSPRRRPRT
jgi:hypothetical protein